MIKHSNPFIILICFLIFSFSGFSQAPQKYFVITGKFEPESGFIENAKVEISKNGKTPTVQNIPKNGRFRFEFEYFNDYELTFTQSEHFSKKILVSTQIPQSVWERDNDFPPFPIVVQLFREIEGLDKSFTQKPIGKIFYSEQEDNFTKESYFSDLQLVEQIEEAKQQNARLNKENNGLSKENRQDNAQLQKEFDKAVKEADEAYQRRDYLAALSKYKEANKLIPSNAYPTDRIAELQDLIKAMELAQAQKAALEQKYKDAIAKADASFDQKAYKQAMPSYEEALGYKPGDAYATGRIQEINNLLAQLEKQRQYEAAIADADKAYNAGKLDQAIPLYQKASAIDASNPYPAAQIDKINAEKQRLAEIAQKEKAYDDAIKEGNKLLKDKNYDKAIDAFNIALQNKPEDQQAQSRIAEARQALDNIEKENNYQKAIATADAALAGNDLEKAKTEYNNALRFKDNDPYAKDKLATIAITEANNEKFARLIADAQNAVLKKDLAGAKDLYSQALSVKPDNKEIPAKIQEIDQQLAQQKLDQQYAELIAAADNSFNTGQLEAAKQSYASAQNLKPKEDYPKQQIQKIDAELARIAKEKADQEQYEKALANGDSQKNAQKYSDAISAYQQALKVRPNDPAANARIAEVQEILAGIERDKNYHDAVKTADAALAANKLEDAKSEYNKALQFKSNDEYVKKQLALIAETEANNEKFARLIADAQNAVLKKDLAGAKDLYSQALSVKPDNKEIPAKIQEIDQQLAQQKLDQQYAELIAAADNSFNTGQLEAAKQSYASAQNLKPKEDYPKQQIQKIDAELARIAKEKADQEQYEKALANGDSQKNAQKYSDAISAYQQALKVRPNDPAANARITEVQEILAGIERDKNYQAAMQQAESEFGKNNFDLAIASFQKALSIKPAETLPAERIRAIEAIREQQRQARILDENYQAAIARADKAFSSQDFAAALTAYTDAINLKATEQYPKDRLEVVKKAMAEKAEQERINQAYSDAIRQADQLLAGKSYRDSRNKYQEAGQYKPAETYPKQQIQKLDQLIAEEEKAKKDAADYAHAMAKADSLFKLDDLLAAKQSYQAASNIYPKEVIPPQKMKEIDNLLAERAKQAEEKAKLEAQQRAINEKYTASIQKADQAFAAKDYSAATNAYNEASGIKPEEKYPKNKLAEIEQILAKQRDDAYQQAIAAANASFNGKQWNDALDQYNKALTIKANDAYATKQIAAINAELEKLKMLDGQYNTAIAEADKLFTNKDYAKAKEAYQRAGAIKPEAEHPKQRIAAIDQLLAEAQKAEELNQRYASAIRSGMDLMNNQRLEEARAQFEKAHEYKPTEPIPPQKIAEIEKLIAQKTELERLAALEKEQQLAKEKADKAKYEAAIAAADRDFSSQKYEPARKNYEAALSVFPQEQYPKNQIAQIEQILKDQATAKQLALAKAQQDSMNNARKRAFDLAFAKAEALEQKSQFEPAIAQFREAEKIIPENKGMVDQRIAQIKERMQTLAKQEQDYRAALAKADALYAKASYTEALPAYQEAGRIKPEETYPKQRISEIQALLTGKENDYQAAIKLADSYFSASDWINAKSKYTEALAIRPTETYPQNQLKEIDKKLADAELARANKEAQDKAYNNAIANGERLMADNDLANAKMQFQAALTIKPREVYPADKIKEIELLLSEQRAKEELAARQKQADEKYRQAIATADKEFSNKAYSAARIRYQEALAIKPAETYPQSQIARIDQLISEENQRKASVQPVQEAPVAQKAEKAKSVPATNKTALAYDEAIAKADDAFTRSRYSIARFYYYKALDIKSQEQYPKDRIEEIRRLTNARLTEKEEREYSETIVKADEAFMANNYPIARFYYNKALEMKDTEQYPKDQLTAINKKIAEKQQGSNDQEYNKLREQGDQAFSQGNLSIARFYYTKALQLKPDETYLKDQLKQIKELVTQKSKITGDVSR
jgi:hypothetical protein